jgi:hypothetical protein
MKYLLLMLVLSGCTEDLTKTQRMLNKLIELKSCEFGYISGVADAGIGRFKSKEEVINSAHIVCVKIQERTEVRK